MEENNELTGEERLKAENEFLKMKLMLEHGAKFGGDENNNLPAEIENQFLNNLIAFEKQLQEQKTVKIFDKLGRPAQFKPGNDIPDTEIDKAWQSLRRHLNDHGIDLGVCSPNVTTRELYRFTVEELFELETNDIDVPGWSTNFIYDEFHPDPVYDNSKLVQRDLFHDMFRKEELCCGIQYVKEGLVFNNKIYQYAAYNEMISRFKSLFNEISLLKCIVTECEVGTEDCIVKGNYAANAKMGNQESIFKGDFTIKLVLMDSEYWYMKNITIEGFDPS